MRQTKTSYWFPLFALFVIFADELFYGFIAVSGTALESGLKSLEAIGIAGIAYLLILKDVVSKKFSSRNYGQFLALIIILILYYITSFQYQTGNKSYWSHLLVYGSLCIPACYVGMRLSRREDDDSVISLLPLFVVVVALVTGRAVIYTSVQGSLLGWGDNDVFNYQNASYYLAFCYSYCFYYVFFINRDRKKTTWERFKSIVMMGMLFVCGIGCILGGGRGAFVYIVAITAYLIYRIFKRGGKSNTKYILLVLGGVLVMVYLAHHFNIFSSSGFMRVADSLTSDDIREENVRKAMTAFKESPIIGHGLGSIWWTVGYYSHNMLTDLLAETGVVGTTIVVIVLLSCLFHLIKSSRINQFDMFMLILFLGALVEDTFSGYWISSSKFFLIFGYVYASLKRKRIKT